MKFVVVRGTPLIASESTSKSKAVVTTVTRGAVATKASSVTRSLKLRYVDLGYSTWMGARQGRPSAVNLRPFVGVDSKL
jgi:hypothetical protein